MSIKTDEISNESKEMELSVDITAGTFVGGRTSSARHCPWYPNACRPSCRTWRRNRCNAHHGRLETVPGNRRSVRHPRRRASFPSPSSVSWNVSPFSVSSSKQSNCPNYCHFFSITFLNYSVGIKNMSVVCWKYFNVKLRLLCKHKHNYMKYSISFIFIK